MLALALLATLALAPRADAAFVGDLGTITPTIDAPVTVEIAGSYGPGPFEFEWAFAVRDWPLTTITASGNAGPASSRSLLVLTAETGRIIGDLSALDGTVLVKPGSYLLRFEGFGVSAGPFRSDIVFTATPVPSSVALLGSALTLLLVRAAGCSKYNTGSRQQQKRLGSESYS
jgi:hypothetical protein